MQLSQLHTQVNNITNRNVTIITLPRNADPNERDAVKYNYCAKSDTKHNFTTQYRIFNRNVTRIM
jgi:hypothetical protein